MLVFLQIFNKFVENFKSNDAVVEWWHYVLPTANKLELLWFSLKQIVDFFSWPTLPCPCSIKSVHYKYLHFIPITSL